MFDIGATELLMIVVVAVIVIGPKDLPLAMRTAGRWIGKVRRLSNHFRSGLDAMVREAEMEDMQKKWREQNERIMREHPTDAPSEKEPTGALPAPKGTSPAPGSAETRMSSVETERESRERMDAPLPGTLPPPLPLPGAGEDRSGATSEPDRRAPASDEVGTSRT